MKTLRGQSATRLNVAAAGYGGLFNRLEIYYNSHVVWKLMSQPLWGACSFLNILLLSDVPIFLYKRKNTIKLFELYAKWSKSTKEYHLTDCRLKRQRWLLNVHRLPNVTSIIRVTTTCYHMVVVTSRKVHFTVVQTIASAHYVRSFERHIVYDWEINCIAD